MVKTAEETFTEITGCIINHRDVKRAMIEFARAHVEAALKAAWEQAEIKQEIFTESGEPIFEINHQSILNAYPLTNIK